MPDNGIDVFISEKDIFVGDLQPVFIHFKKYKTSRKSPNHRSSASLLYFVICWGEAQRNVLTYPNDLCF